MLLIWKSYTIPIIRFHNKATIAHLSLKVKVNKTIHIFTCKIVKFSRTLFIMYFSGKCLSLWIKLIMYSHMGERWILYTYFPPSRRAYSVYKTHTHSPGRCLLAKVVSRTWFFKWAKCKFHSSYLYFFDNLLAKRADFGWNGDCHVLVAAVLAADAVERAGAVLHAAAVQIRL